MELNGIISAVLTKQLLITKYISQFFTESLQITADQ